MSYNSFPSNLERKSPQSISLPAMFLFGNRFYSDQPNIELLIEFLCVLDAVKTINEVEDDSLFPEMLDSQKLETMQYTLNHRLNFKLFSLWDSGKSTKASESHYTRFNEIKAELKKHLEAEDSKSQEKHMDILANLYQGFQISGAERDWCARSFLPVSRKLLMGETIWMATKANSATEDHSEFEAMKKYFSHSSRLFYSRGGEILYLQLLLAFTKTESEVNAFLESNPRYKSLRLVEGERDPKFLRDKLKKGLETFLDSKYVPSAFNTFIDFIESEFSKREGDQQYSYNITKNQNIGSIPQESWYLGYLFALELSRLFESHFDAIDLIALLEAECTLQMLRTMLFQCAGYLGEDPPEMAVVSLNSKSAALKTISSRSLSRCKMVMKNAFEAIVKNQEVVNGENIKLLLESEGVSTAQIHNKQGFKCFVKHAKELGLVVPKTGGNEHFVLTKNMLVLLVSTTLMPGESLTFESFIKDVFIRYGFVFDEDGFTRVNTRCGLDTQVADSEICDWLINMLDDCGYYIALSDALSLVKNTNIGEA